jgi:hypothetical protein
VRKNGVTAQNSDSAEHPGLLICDDTNLRPPTSSSTIPKAKTTAQNSKTEFMTTVLHHVNKMFGATPHAAAPARTKAATATVVLAPKMLHTARLLLLMPCSYDDPQATPRCTQAQVVPCRSHNPDSSKNQAVCTLMRQQARNTATAVGPVCRHQQKHSYCLSQCGTSGKLSSERRYF